MYYTYVRAERNSRSRQYFAVIEAWLKLNIHTFRNVPCAINTKCTLSDAHYITRRSKPFICPQTYSFNQTDNANICVRGPAIDRGKTPGRENLVVWRKSGEVRRRKKKSHIESLPFRLKVQLLTGHLLPVKYSSSARPLSVQLNLLYKNRLIYNSICSAFGIFIPTRRRNAIFRLKFDLLWAYEIFASKRPNFRLLFFVRGWICEKFPCRLWRVWWCFSFAVGCILVCRICWLFCFFNHCRI